MLRLVPPIHRATHRIGLYLADLRDEALSQGEAHILALLATAGASTIAELHRGLSHKRSTLTSILDRWRSGDSSRARSAPRPPDVRHHADSERPSGGPARPPSSDRSRARRRGSRVERRHPWVSEGGGGRGRGSTSANRTRAEVSSCKSQLSQSEVSPLSLQT